MRRITYLLIFLPFLISLPASLYGQDWSVGSNVLYWSTTTPNMSIEYGFHPKMSVSVTGSYNPFQYGSRDENKKLKHWLIQPEFRLWNCERNVGSFYGFHAHYGRFNAGGVKMPLGIWEGLRDNRFEGSYIGFGVSYGYQWILSPRWNVEATFGFGYSYIDYKKYECKRCGDYIGKSHKHYLGPTRLGVSMVYLFKL